MADQRISGATPRPRVRKMPVIRVKSTEGRTFTSISPTVFGQYIHYAAGRSHECTADFKDCRGCKDNWPQSWKGILHCQDWSNEMEECFLEITEHAVEQIWKQIPPKMSLRGLILQVKKTKGGAKGRYIITVLERKIAEDQLPQPKDPLETLRFLWACKNQSVEDPKK